MTTTKQCNCTGPAAEYQDKIYGKGMRLFNLKLDNKGAKCTVCGTLKK